MLNPRCLNSKADTPRFATNANPLPLYRSPRVKILAFNEKLLYMFVLYVLVSASHEEKSEQLERLYPYIGVCSGQQFIHCPVSCFLIQCRNHGCGMPLDHQGQDIYYIVILQK